MPIINRLSHLFLETVIFHPKKILALFVALTVALGWQARNFRIDASADTLLMQNDPNYILTQTVNHRFSPQEFLLVAYKPKNHPLLSEQTFSDLRALERKLLKIDRVESVRSILNVPLFSQIQGGIASADDISQWTITLKDFSINQIKEEFQGHPLYEDLLINREQTATAIQVLFKNNPDFAEIDRQIVALQRKSLKNSGLSGDEKQKLQQLKAQADTFAQKLDKIRIAEIEAIRRMVEPYEENAEIYLGGLHVLGFQLIQIIKNDLIVFGGAISALICVVLFLLFRKIRWVILPIMCCGCSVVTTLGLFGLLGYKATVISANFTVLQLILTLAIVIHLIVQYREYAGKQPELKQSELVQKTLYKKAGPCFFAGITTSVGFGSLLFSGIQPVITFGWMMIIAMFISIGVSLILFPAIMVLTGKEVKVRPWPFSRRILDFFIRLTLKHSALVTAVSATALMISLGGSLFLDVENSFINYFRDSTKVHKELSFIDQELGGSTSLDMVYTIPDTEQKKDLVLTADTVQKMQRVQHALVQHEAMGKMLSVVSFSELAKQVNDGKPLTEYELTAFYWSIDDALRENLLGSFFAPEHAQLRISALIKDSTKGLDRAMLLEDIRKDIETAGIPESSYTLSNLFILYQDILQQLFRSQILTLGIVYAALMLTFLAIFRSMKIALIGITPNILSTLMVLGVMGWLGISLDLMTITIAAVAMGIAVDDTIHYIHRYLEELENASPDKAVEGTHKSVGYAVLYTSLIIILGFSLLTFSDFVPSIIFGLLTGFAMFAALVFALSLLPVLLNRFVSHA